MATATLAQETKVTAKKAAAKAAPAKAPKKATAKPAKAAQAKPAKKAATPRKAKAVEVAPVKPEARFTIVNRPSSGVILFAYTQAAMGLLGMFEGTPVPQARIVAIMGATALRYHLAKQTFDKNESGDIVLTVAGRAFFEERNAKAAPAHVEAFTRMMVEGVEDGVINKNPNQVVALKA